MKKGYEKKDLTAALEAILFVRGEEADFGLLAKILKVKEEEVGGIINNLENNLSERGSGLSLIKNKKTVKMVTRSDLAGVVEDLIKDNLDSSLSPAALETLTIVLYLAPVSRAEIDHIRGVNSTYTLRALLVRGLIKRLADKKRPYIYLFEPTFDLLQYMGVKSVEDLPDYEENGKALRSYQQIKEN